MQVRGCFTSRRLDASHCHQPAHYPTANVVMGQPAFGQPVGSGYATQPSALYAQQSFNTQPPQGAFAAAASRSFKKLGSLGPVAAGGLVGRMKQIAGLANQQGGTSAEDGGGRDWDTKFLFSKLQSIVSTNSLQAFYPPKKLEAVVQQLAQVNFRDLAARWRIPVELAYDLATLALYDIIIYADDSGSMAFEDNGSRIEDLEFILGRVAEVATLFDSDGINIRFINSDVKADGVTDAAAASALLKSVRFTGMTPLGTNLARKVIKPFLEAGVQRRSLAKPILVITITDGEPSGEPQGSIFDTINNARKLVTSSMYGPKAVAFQFAQVGRDTRAQAFLETLDNHPVVGGMVDATSYFELEAEECARKGVMLTPELWLLKLMVGAVDPYYDAQD